MADQFKDHSSRDEVPSRGWLSTQKAPKGSKRISHVSTSCVSRRSILRQTQLKTKPRESTTNLTKQGSLSFGVTKTDTTHRKDSSYLYSRLSDSDEHSTGQINLSSDTDNTCPTNNWVPMNTREISPCDKKYYEKRNSLDQKLHSGSPSILTEHDMNIATFDNFDGNEEKLNLQFETKETSSSVYSSPLKEKSMITTLDVDKDNPRCVRRTLSLKTNTDSDDVSLTEEMVDIETKSAYQDPLDFIPSGGKLFSSQQGSISKVYRTRPPTLELENSRSQSLTLDKSINTISVDGRGKRSALTFDLSSDFATKTTQNVQDDADIEFSSCWSEMSSSSSTSLGGAISLRETEKLSKEKYKLMMGTLDFSDLNSVSSW